ncbi:MAG: glutamate-cysteine ligase family protein, partial [Planctomycetota bacterium]
ARALVWRGIDPSRTGFPGPKGRGATKPFSCTFDCFVEAALDARVMLIRHRDGSGATVGNDSFRLRDWIVDGHPELGPPTLEDIEYHLTTLFFEVRPRGFLEIRGADALPTRYRSALVAFFCGLIYDDQARRESVERLRRVEGGTEELARLGLEESYSSSEYSQLTKDVWKLALEGASRLPASFLREEDLRSAENFFERFPSQGRAPLDELVTELDRSPADALAWARE